MCGLQDRDGQTKNLTTLKVKIFIRFKFVCVNMLEIMGF